MLFRFISVLIFSLSWIFAQVHEISGKTVDTKNGSAAIAGVNIILSGGDEGVASDVDGNFTLSTKHSFPFSLNVSHIGYDPLTITVENDSFLLIELTAVVIVGQEIDVMGVPSCLIIKGNRN